MTDKEYLLAYGWHERWENTGAEPDDRWTHGRLTQGPPLTLAQAVAAQLADDRARHNFMRERSEIENGLLVAPRAGLRTSSGCRLT